MAVNVCPNCGKEVAAGEFRHPGAYQEGPSYSDFNCRYCGYSGLPLSVEKSALKKMKFSPKKIVNKKNYKTTAVLLVLLAGLISATLLTFVGFWPAMSFLAAAGAVILMWYSKVQRAML